MTIKSRVTKLEKQRAGRKTIRMFQAQCAVTNGRLTEQSSQAVFSCGNVKEIYQRKAGEQLRDFEKRVLRAGGRLAVERHPNSIFVYGGAKRHAQ